MEILKKDFNLLLEKYDFYDKIEPNLSWGDLMQFETFKEILEKGNKNNLKIFVNGYGVETIIKKIKNFVYINIPEMLSESEIDIMNIRDKVNNIIS